MQNVEFLTYVCRSQRLAGSLMIRGFKLHEIKPSKNDPRKNVFLFTNSKELREEVERYKNQKLAMTM